MTADQNTHLTSVQEYLDTERASAYKREYLNGYVFERSGCDIIHNHIAVNLCAELHQQLLGKGYAVLNSLTKVQISTRISNRFYYPDAMVICESSPAYEEWQDRPVVLAEVMSNSTRRIDQVEKCDAYQTLPSLQVYLIVEPAAPRVEVYRRRGDAFVAELVEGLDGVVELAEIDCTLKLSDLYERVDFAVAEQEETALQAKFNRGG